MTLSINTYSGLIKKAFLYMDLVTYLMFLLRINLKLIHSVYFRSTKENKVLHVFFFNEMQSSA
jgi:hypothetical protein